MNDIIRTGWDIGGAHLKVAQCDQNDQFLQAIELPCPLWQGLDKLEQAISEAIQQILPSQQHRLTMTGELVDIFPNRQVGVNTILDTLHRALPNTDIKVYAGSLKLLSIGEARKHWQQVASKNWLASASYAAQQQGHGLFIDVGSTTSDIILFHDHSVHPIGHTDYERQISHELHYAGAIRTPLIALAQVVPFNNHRIRIAAELFATTGDCWCLMDQLNPNDIHDTSSDGESWDKDQCINRLARLLGADGHQHSRQHWLDLASWFCELQIQQLTQSIQHVLSAHAALPKGTPIIGAGVGRFMIKRCAENLSMPYRDFSESVDPVMPSAADHAPAAALALLADGELT